jgi:hypothetical protein
MLPALLPGCLAAPPPPPPLVTTSSTASPSAHLRTLRLPSGLAVSRRAGFGEAARAAATERGAIEEEEEEEEGFPEWGNGDEDEYDHDPEIGDIMGEYFDDPNKAQSRVSARLLFCPSLPFTLCPSSSEIWENLPIFGFADGGEDKEEAAQDRAGQDRLTQPHEGRLQQVMLLSPMACIEYSDAIS